MASPGRRRHHAAVLEHDRAVAEVGDLVRGVADEDDRAALVLELRIRSMHLRWNGSSPTASTSSTSRRSGSTWTATANASRTYMPDE